MTNSFITRHVNRADRNLLILYVIIFIICSLVVTVVYATSGLYTPYFVCLAINLTIIIACTGFYTNRVTNIKKSPIFKTLTKFGDFDNVRVQIDAEAASNASVRKGQLLFTQNWILQPYLGGLHVINRATLVWVYARDLATKHSINFIPTGTTHTYSVVLHYTAPAKKQGFISVLGLEIKTDNEAASRDLLVYVLRYAPWVVAGHTPEIANSWKMNVSGMLDAIKHRYDTFVLGSIGQKSQTHAYVDDSAVQIDPYPFTVLGVSTLASQTEVKEAYQKKAWIAHPDHGGNNEAMTEINIAYQTICKSKGWLQ